MTDKNLVEVARAFSYKMALPNYSNVDFFCSEKAEVPIEEAEKKSEELYQFCRNEVLKSVKHYLNESKPKPGNAVKDMEDWQKHYNQISQLDDVKRSDLETNIKL